MEDDELTDVRRVYTCKKEDISSPSFDDEFYLISAAMHPLKRKGYCHI